MNHRVLSLLMVLAAASLAAQQAPPAKETPTFKAGTEFVQVPVIVQKDGKHLAGLTKEMFSVKQDGNDQLLVAFEEIQVKPESRPDGSFDNQKRADNEHIVILAIDTINTPVLDQTYFTGELVDFLSHAKTSTTTYGLVQMVRSGIQVLHDFTRNPAELLETVKRLDSNLPQSNRDASAFIGQAANEVAQQQSLAREEDAERVQMLFDNTALTQQNETAMLRFQDRAARIDTVLTLQQLAQALKGIPGRKTLIWVGSGLQFMGGIQEISKIRDTTYNLGKVGEAMDMQTYTWKLLNDANVAVYPIDARRTVNAAYQFMDTSRKYSAQNSEKEMAYQSDREIVSTFRAFASQTGGKPCVFRTDLKNCVREAVEDGSAYYLLGFYVDKKSSTPGWHKVTVKLDQKASLQYRSGFIISKEAPEAKRMTDLQLAMNSPFPFTALPFSGRFTGVTAQGAKRSVGYQLRIPPSAVTLTDNKINLDVVAVFRTVGGKEAGRMAQRIERELPPAGIADIQSRGIDYRNKMDLPPGEYGVWFVLRDNPTGRTGSVTVPLRVN